MDGQRSIDGGGGGIHHGRQEADVDMAALQIPPQGRTGGGKLSSWFGRLAGGGRKERRGSIGFTAEINHGPLARMDEDSNSGMEVIASTTANREESRGIGFRRRDISFSDLQTPGGDGDTFVFQYRRRNSSTPDFSSLHIQDGGGGLVPHTAQSETTSVMQPILEGQRLQYTTSQDTLEGRMSTSDQRTANHFMPSQQQEVGRVHEGEEGKGPGVKEGREDGASIFLIDLEPTEEGAGLVIKPKSKKFSAASFFQSKLTQSWFFRNGGEEEEAASDGYSDNGDRSPNGERSRKSSADEVREESPEVEEDTGLTFVGKFRKAVDQHPRNLKEMNTWQPQSH